MELLEIEKMQLICWQPRVHSTTLAAVRCSNYKFIELAFRMRYICRLVSRADDNDDEDDDDDDDDDT